MFLEKETIKKVLRNRKKLESKLKIKIDIKNNGVELIGDELNVYVAKKVLEALERNFPLNAALCNGVSFLLLGKFGSAPFASNCFTISRLPIYAAIWSGVSLYLSPIFGFTPNFNNNSREYIAFQKPDFSRFPCLALACRAAKTQGTMPAVMNAANEVAVDGFLKNGLNFISIPKIIEKVLDRHKSIKNPNLSVILEADAWARRKAVEAIKRL